MSVKIPLRKEGEIPSEVRTWSEFTGTKVI